MLNKKIGVSYASNLVAKETFFYIVLMDIKNGCSLYIKPMLENPQCTFYETFSNPFRIIL